MEGAADDLDRPASGGRAHAIGARVRGHAACAMAPAIAAATPRRLVAAREGLGRSSAGRDGLAPASCYTVAARDVEEDSRPGWLSLERRRSRWCAARTPRPHRWTSP